MIRRIKTLKNFGIFKDFTWSGDLQDFKEKNIFYGWNYSGKTTLSRLFSSVKANSLPLKYPNAEFTLVHGDDKKELKQTGILTHDLSIQVFNADYIKKNLRWDSDESLDSIAFDVGENVATRDAINANLKEIELIRGTKEVPGKIAEFKPRMDAFNEFDSHKFTKEASKIKNDVFNSLIEFTKTHFKSVKTVVESDLDKYVIKDEAQLKAIKQTAIATNNKGEIPAILFKPKFSELIDRVRDLLNSEPTETEVIERLENNNELYSWVDTGLTLHDNDQSDQTCAFCENPISLDRFKQLKNYFSNAAASLRKDISECKELIDLEIAALDKINTPRSKNDFAEKFQDSVVQQARALVECKNDYKRRLSDLLTELDRKEAGNIFQRIEISNESIEATTALRENIEAYQSIIDSNNGFIANFTREQTTARDKLKKHLVSKFLIDEQYESKLKAKQDAEAKIKGYEEQVTRLQTSNTELEAKLKDIAAARLELNRFIKIFLNRDDIRIEVTADDRFMLQRGTDVAHHLSEGEKTAIAFSYFLVSLEGLKTQNKLKDQIIFIDDPISSLDANHIAQIYSLINSFFFRKGLDLTSPEKVVNCFKQLFISTHNFEFFSFLKDSNQINKKKKKDDADGKKGEGTCEYYLVKRIANDRSEIKAMPTSMKSYKSEYIYLFEIIFNFHKGGCQENDDKFILMPNALRRFLEIYTLMKLPHMKDEFDSRVAELMGEGNQLKFLNHFSHFTTFEKLTKHDELIMSLPSACDELMELLNQDEGHFNSLKRAINAKN